MSRYICLIHTLPKWKRLQDKLLLDGATLIWQLQIDDVSAIQAWQIGNTIKIYMHPHAVKRLRNSHQWISEFTYRISELERLTATMVIETSDKALEYANA